MSAPDFTSARWRKSTRSNQDTACVEVASAEGLAGVRDSKEQGRGPILAFNRGQWAAFVNHLRSGDLDLRCGPRPRRRPLLSGDKEPRERGVLVYVADPVGDVASLRQVISPVLDLRTGG